MSGIATPAPSRSDDERQFIDVVDVDFDEPVGGAALESIGAIAARTLDSVGVYPRVEDTGETLPTVPGTDVVAALGAEPIDQVTAIASRAMSFVDSLKAHRITNDATFLECNDLFKSATRMLDEIAATFDPIIAAANKAHKEAIAQRNKHSRPIEEALATLKRTFLTEKTRRDVEAERERLAATQQVQAEVEQAATEIAEELTAEGLHDEAAQVVEQARSTDVAPLLPASTVVNRLANVGTTGTWKVNEAEIDLMTLVKAIAAGTAPIQAVTASLPYLNGRARTDKNALNIPGVKAVFVPSVRVRR